MHRRSLLGLVASLLLFAGSSLAQDSMTRLRSEAKTLGGNPVERASVVVRFIEGRSKIKLGKKIVTTWELKTNQEGWAKIPPIPQGKIQVQVIAKGFQTYGQVYDINEEERTVEIKLNPPQPQFSVHQ